jgi:hypothetical protein
VLDVFQEAPADHRALGKLRPIVQYVETSDHCRLDWVSGYYRQGHRRVLFASIFGWRTNFAR